MAISTRSPRWLDGWMDGWIDSHKKRVLSFKHPKSMRGVTLLSKGGVLKVEVSAPQTGYHPREEGMLIYLTVWTIDMDY